MKPLIEVYVGRHCCYDKEIPWHWDDGTNGLLTPLSGMALRRPVGNSRCMCAKETQVHDVGKCHLLYPCLLLLSQSSSNHVR